MVKKKRLPEEISYPYIREYADGYYCYQWLVRTEEDWHPNFNENYVRVSMGLLPSCAIKDNRHRVSVWGNDDFGMDIDLPTKEEALKITRILCKSKNVTRELCKSLGMEYV